jgi:phosphoserine phosphatase RsbU/P
MNSSPFRNNSPRAATQLTVREVMQPDPVCVRADTPIRDVLRQMNRNRIGAILVVRADGRLVGIFTERDLLKRVISAIPGWREYPVSDWMTVDPYTITPDLGWDEAVGLMTKLRVRHLPVLEGGTLVGVISSRALMKRREEHLDRKVAERTAELRHANDLLLSKEAETVANLRAAGRLQQGLLLPHAPPSWAELEWGIHFAPLDHLGGDYYDFATPDAEHLGILIADASGHSLPAAMVAIMTRIVFAEVANRTTKPGEVLGVMNARLQDLAGERFVSAFYGVLHRPTRQFRFACAGHPSPLLWDARAKSVRRLVANGFLLGILPDECYIEQQIQLHPGDCVCFYTDGLVEARNTLGAMFGADRLHESLTANGARSATRMTEEVVSAQREFSDGTPLGDDLTIVTMGIAEPTVRN